MYIHREGYKTIGITALVVCLIIVLSLQFLGASFPILATVISIAALAFFVFIISFFRIPSRKFTTGDNLVVAPADGKVVVIEEVEDKEYFNGKRLQISIFMSPLNVHVNRHPIDGEIVYSQYHKGKYLVAWDPKSSTDNERHSVVYKHKSGIEILAKQIAGALAKRICNYCEVGSPAVQNNEMGFIKFGSRVDMLLPLGTQYKVKIGDMVQNGVTVIAEL